MAKRKTKVWKERGWERGEQLPGGNQGHTFLARRAADPADEFGYVLKSLKRQDDAVLRRRFHIEVQSLTILDHPSVSKCVESNADRFAEPEDLFLITERIRGPDLERFGEGPVELKAAVGVVIRVLGILKHCHDLNVLHRDIKPCHVILRNGVISDPCLIDFGLAFNEIARPADFETASAQGVGNRFIILPEQLGEGPDKRDFRSDITQCLGLLFFLLTRHRPGLIYDASGTKPHERLRIDAGVCDLDVKSVSKLDRVFGIGFEHDPTRRWQSVDTLVGELRVLEDGSVREEPIDFESRLGDLRERTFKSPENERLMQIDTLQREFSRAAQAANIEVMKKFHELIACAPTSSKSGSTTGMHSMAYAVNHKFKDAKRSKLTLAIEPRGAELYMSAEVFGQEITTATMGLFDPDASRLMASFVEDAWVRALDLATS